MSKETQVICGRKFPSNIVKNWSDINIQKEVGKGSFGKVYQAFLNLNEVQRYVCNLIFFVFYKEELTILTIL